MTSPDLPAAAAGSRWSLAARPLSPDDFVVLNDEIRTFVRAGIPLDIGLRGTAGRTDGALRDLSERLSHRLEMGISLEAALAAEQGRLPAAYQAVLTAGLRTGRLDKVLASLSELTESTTALRQQLNLSIIYPAIVVTLAYGLFTAFVVVVVPQLQRTYTFFDMQLTRTVALLIWLRRTVSIWGIAVPLSLIGLVLIWEVGQRVWGGGEGSFGISRWIPGRRDLSLARFARVMSLLVEHGAPLPEACRLSGQAAGDWRTNSAAQHLATTIEGGRPLQAAMERDPRLPAFLRWLIVVGERQGSLPVSLKQAAAVYEQRALSKLDWFRRVMPPVTVVLCCGTITMLYALTLFVPLAEMIRRLGQG